MPPWRREATWRITTREFGPLSVIVGESTRQERTPSAIVTTTSASTTKVRTLECHWSLNAVSLRWRSLAGVPHNWGWMSKRLDVMRIQGEVIEVGELLHQKDRQRASVAQCLIGTHIFELLNKLRMLVRNMFLNERSRFEQLLASLASEFTLVFLLQVRFNGLA